MVHFSSSSVNLFSAKSARVILQRKSIYNTMLEKQVIKSKKDKVPKFREMKHTSRKAYLHYVESEGGGSTCDGYRPRLIPSVSVSHDTVMPLLLLFLALEIPGMFRCWFSKTHPIITDGDVCAAVELLLVPTTDTLAPVRADPPAVSGRVLPLKQTRATLHFCWQAQRYCDLGLRALGWHHEARRVCVFHNQREFLKAVVRHPLERIVCWAEAELEESLVVGSELNSGVDDLTHLVLPHDDAVGVFSTCLVLAFSVPWVATDAAFPAVLTILNLDIMGGNRQSCLVEILPWPILKSNPIVLPYY